MGIWFADELQQSAMVQVVKRGCAMGMRDIPTIT
jgi:hypothetical protein